MALASTSGLMETDMRETGTMTKSMARASKPGLMEENTRETGRMTNCMVRAAIPLLMEMYIVYEGDWPDDDQHGRGRITRRSGNTYEEDIRSMFANAFASAMSSGKREWIAGVWKYE